MFLVIEYILLLALAGFAIIRADMLELELEGIDNCPNKCDKVFDRSQYAISDQPGADTFEFRSCNIGCKACSNILAKLPPNGTVAGLDADGGKSCFKYCKTFNYNSQAIRKGLIEPDKACIMGCIVNTCQEICTGGTTDHSVTPSNRLLWWGLGGNGCSIKSNQGYVQNPAYGNPNSPGGLGANIGPKQCCAQLINLCSYRGPQNINFQNVEVVARRFCARFIPQQDLNNNTALCSLYNTPQFCGTPGMSGVGGGTGTGGGA